MYPVLNGRLLFFKLGRIRELGSGELGSGEKKNNLKKKLKNRWDD
jgi:hypothetical protein